MQSLRRALLYFTCLSLFAIALTGCGSGGDPATEPKSPAAEDQPVPEDVPEPTI